MLRYLECYNWWPLRLNTGKDIGHPSASRIFTRESDDPTWTMKPSRPPQPGDDKPEAHHPSPPPPLGLKLEIGQLLVYTRNRKQACTAAAGTGRLPSCLNSSWSLANSAQLVNIDFGMAISYIPCTGPVSAFFSVLLTLLSYCIFH